MSVVGHYSMKKVYWGAKDCEGSWGALILGTAAVRTPPVFTPLGGLTIEHYTWTFIKVTHILACRICSCVLQPITMNMFNFLFNIYSM